MFFCTILTSDSELEAVASAWRRLQESAGKIPFTGYDWFQAWWQHIGKPAGKELHIIIGREDERLVAVMPLVVTRKRGALILQGIGIDESFPCDMLLENPDHAKLMWDAARQSRRYDFAAIKDVDPGTPCGQALATFAKEAAREQYPCLRIDWKISDEWLASLPRGKRSNRKRCLRRLEEKGPVQFLSHTEGPLPTAIVEGMIAQKQAWAVRNNKGGIFKQAGAADFYRALVKAADDAKQLSLAWLQCGDRIIAYRLAFSYRKTSYGYLISHDPAWAAFSPGNLLRMQSNCWAIDSGYREVNLMRGVKPDKLDCANEVRDYVEWVFSASPAGKIKETVYIAYLALWKIAYKIWKTIESRRRSNPLLKIVYVTLQSLRGKK